MKKILLFFWNVSIGELYRIMFKQEKKKFILPTKEFLLSAKYQNIMNQYLPYTGEYGKFESYTYTRSYINRHHTYQHVLGVFRWRGMQENLKNILPLVSDSNRIVIDFGGGGCPLGLGSIIVDKLKKDITGNAVKYHELTEIKGKVNVVFASHVFEHVQNLEQALNDIAEILNNDGHLICMVPSFSNPYWNAGGHNHEVFGPHVWTMGLSETDRSIISKIPFYIDIDTLISNYLKIEIAEYCGDDCIFILASKNVLSDNK